MDLGKGTALGITSPAMLAIRERIADHFHGVLTGQDRHSPRLHITVQNKVSRTDAVTLQKEFSAWHLSREFAFTGLGLHIYLGPHWQAEGTWRFRGKEGG